MDEMKAIDVRRWKKAFATLAVLAFPLLTAGCYKMDVDARGLQPHLYMSGHQAAPTELQTAGTFDIEARQGWLLWGLSPLRSPDIESLVAEEVRLRGGSGVASTTITTENTFVDGLLSALTLGIYSRRTIRVEGVIVE
jgi:hypothetical protein